MPTEADFYLVDTQSDLQQDGEMISVADLHKMFRQKETIV